MKPTEEQSNSSAATSIRNASWQQCSVFRPSEELLNILPNYMQLQSDEWLIVATQTCSIVSDSFDKERLVEVIAARRLEHYNPKHGRAKGNESIYFHLPISGHLAGQETVALECDLGRRAFFPRVCLSKIEPQKTWCALADLNAFKGWIANYYTRVALPDQLVKRLRLEPSGLVTQITRKLKERLNGCLVADGVKSFYISWRPDEELPEDRLYEIELIVACNDAEVAEILEEHISRITTGSSGPLSIERVLLSDFIVQPIDNITLDQIVGKFRFNEWDTMSSLPKRLESVRDTQS